MSAAMSRPPLEGVSVLEVGVLGAGPLTGLLLADLGADVVKIEDPRGGDIYRGYPPKVGDQSHYFIPLNRNKKSLAIDLKSEEGKQAVLELARRSDVLIENRRPGVMARLGLGYDRICNVNPRIVYCSISGFGQSGPLTDMGGYDLIIQGMAGLMTMVGHQGSEPVKVIPAVPDIAAALLATVGIAAALPKASVTGVGDYIDMSLFDATLFTLSVIYLPYFLGTGKSPAPMGSEHPLVASVQAFQARDGRYLTTGVVAEWMWPSLCTVLRTPHLVDDVRFRNGAARLANRDALKAELSAAFLRADRDEWVERLNLAGIPSGPVLDFEEALNSAQSRARGLFMTLPDDRVAEDLRYIANPIRYGKAQLRAPHAAPTLGEHSMEILAGLGYARSDLARWEADGIIAC